MYLEVSSNGFIWVQLASFTGIQYTWMQVAYSLNDYLEEPFIQISFRFYSDTYVVRDGMYIDDFEINVEEIVSVDNPIVKLESISNYPNPFNPTTTISFSPTESTENAEIEIFNIKGQKIKTLICRPELVEGGQGTVTWNGTDENGYSVSSGIYFYKLKAGNIEKTKKMLLMK